MMRIICGILSVLFCILAWVLLLRKKSSAAWASECSLVFVSLTLLMEYKLVVDWVNKGEWMGLVDRRCSDHVFSSYRLHNFDVFS